MQCEVDAVVVGAGVNGLVAAAGLARAGWAVALVEGNPELGGFIASAERTLPGYTHDTYSSWHPLFTSGAAYAALGPELEEHGLRYRNTEGVITGSIGYSGYASVAYRDPEATADRFASARDRATYLKALQRFLDDAEPIGALMGAELRSVRALRAALALARSARREGAGGIEGRLREVVTSGRGWCREQFEGPETDHLWVPWLLHAGLSPDHASGGFLIPVLAATVHGFGLPVVEGGAQGFVAAFESLLRAHGARIITGAWVDEILVREGRTIGVRAGGLTVHARRAVLASVTPQALYGSLLNPASVPERVAEQAARFRYGRAEMQIHVALSRPLQLSAAELNDAPLVHLSDGSAGTAIACAEAEAGLLPRRPTVVVGRQHLLDPSRVPDGAGSLWLQLQEVPFDPVGDAAGELDTKEGWTPDLARGYADRVLGHLGRLAPGLADSVLAVDVITPVDLSRRNPNAVAGDPYGGSAELDQNFVWRPVPAAARHATAIDGLWHIGASTHPGPGLGGGSGHLVARLLTRARRTGATRAAGPKDAEQTGARPSAGFAAGNSQQQGGRR